MKSIYVTGSLSVQHATTSTARLFTGIPYFLPNLLFFLRCAGTFFCAPSSCSSSSSEDEGDSSACRMSSAISGSSSPSSSLDEEDVSPLDRLAAFSSSASSPLSPSGGDFSRVNASVLVEGTSAAGCAPWRGSAGRGSGNRLKCNAHMSRHTICSECQGRANWKVEKRTYLELRRQLPYSCQSCDLHAQEQLQALEVMIARPVAMIDWPTDDQVSHTSAVASSSSRLGSALLCRSFFFRVDLSVRFLTACGPSSVTSLVSLR